MQPVLGNQILVGGQQQVEAQIDANPDAEPQLQKTVIAARVAKDTPVKYVLNLSVSFCFFFFQILSFCYITLQKPQKKIQSD